MSPLKENSSLKIQGLGHTMRCPLVVLLQPLATMPAGAAAAPTALFPPTTHFPPATPPRIWNGQGTPEPGPS